MADRAQMRMIRRGLRDPQSQPQPQARVFPRGTAPQARVREVVAAGHEIPIRPAATPRPRRSEMISPPGVLLQQGLTSIDERLVELITLFRQVHGFDEADRELDELRTENQQLHAQLVAADQEIADLRAALGGDAEPLHDDAPAQDDGQ